MSKRAMALDGLPEVEQPRPSTQPRFGPDRKYGYIDLPRWERDGFALVQSRVFLDGRDVTDTVMRLHDEDGWVEFVDRHIEHGAVSVVPSTRLVMQQDVAPGGWVPPSTGFALYGGVGGTGSPAWQTAMLGVGEGNYTNVTSGGGGSGYMSSTTYAAPATSITIGGGGYVPEQLYETCWFCQTDVPTQDVRHDTLGRVRCPACFQEYLHQIATKGHAS